MLSVDTFKSKFQTAKRESDARNAYQAMDNAYGAEKTSIEGSSIHSWKSLNSLLSGSLISTDVPFKGNGHTFRNIHLGYIVQIEESCYNLSSTIQ